MEHIQSQETEGQTRGSKHRNRIKDKEGRDKRQIEQLDTHTVRMTDRQRKTDGQPDTEAGIYTKLDTKTETQPEADRHRTIQRDEDSAR